MTAMELPEILAEAAKHFNILRKAAEAGGLQVVAMINIQDLSNDSLSSTPLMVVENGCGSPCIDFRQVSSELAAATKDADLVQQSFDPASYYSQVYRAGTDGDGFSPLLTPAAATKYNRNIALLSSQPSQSPQEVEALGEIELATKLLKDDDDMQEHNLGTLNFCHF